MKGDAMNSIDIKRIPTLSLVVAAVISLVGCSSAKPTDDPGVDRMGDFMLMNKDITFQIMVPQYLNETEKKYLNLSGIKIVLS